MSVRFDRGAWEVRWRDQTRRLRAKRFTTEEAARVFDDALLDTRPSERAAAATRGAKGSVYPYKTAAGTRWRYVLRRSDGRQTSKRGFISQRAAHDAYRPWSATCSP